MASDSFNQDRLHKKKVGNHVWFGDSQVPGDKKKVPMNWT